MTQRATAGRAAREMAGSCLPPAEPRTRAGDAAITAGELCGARTG
jgi:hypothetical protein